jgi:hypothetical protein
VTLRQFDLITGAFTNRLTVNYRSFLHRGADRSLIFGTESYTPFPRLFTYDPATDSFHTVTISATLTSALAAVNRDGSLIALKFGGQVSLYDRNLNVVRILGNLNGAVAFDPLRDLLYAGSLTTDQVIAYDTTTWAEQFRIDIGEHIGSTTPFGSGDMAVSDDGSLLFLSTLSGVRVLQTPAAPGRAGAADPALMSAGLGAHTSWARGRPLDRFEGYGALPPEPAHPAAGVAGGVSGANAFQPSTGAPRTLPRRPMRPHGGAGPASNDLLLLSDDFLLAVRSRC